MTRKLQTREDVAQLVNVFYQKVRKDKLLAPVFTNSIKDHQWEEHIEKLTGFWMTALFGVKSYKGNPALVHKSVDRENDYVITQAHFIRWLFHWEETVKELFEGENSLRAIASAKRMALGLINVITEGKFK